MRLVEKCGSQETKTSSEGAKWVTEQQLDKITNEFEQTFVSNKLTQEPPVQVEEDKQNSTSEPYTEFVKTITQNIQEETNTENTNN